MAGRTPGPRARLPRVACPDPAHRGSRVKANGTRETKSGRRRDYRCYPAGDIPHNFPVLLDVPGRTMPSYSTPPECPTHGANGNVVRDGTYGPKGESLRRQKYRCTPHEPAEKAKYPKGVHYFTPPRAREHVHFGVDHCAECEEYRGVHRGEQVVARRQSWNLRVVAEGLSRLSAGESYSSVSRWALDSTGRGRTRPAKLSVAEKKRRAAVKAWRATLPRRKRGVAEPAPPAGVSLVALAGDPNPARRHRVDSAGEQLPPRRRPSSSSARARARWHIAADWTATYSASLWLPLKERLEAEEKAEHTRRDLLGAAGRVSDARPQVLLLDDLPVVTKARPDGFGNRRPTRSYFILAAGTLSWRKSKATPDGETIEQPEADTRVRLLRGFATNETASWFLLFEELGYVSGVYEPEVVLADAGTGLQAAAKQFFKTALNVPSLWHAQQAIAAALWTKTPGAVVITDLGRALRPDLSDMLDELSPKGLRAMGVVGWHAWWDDLETLMNREHLSTEAIGKRRTTYEGVFTDILPKLIANPTIPVSTGGLETVLRNTASSLIAGRSHALSNVERLASLLDLAVCRNQGVFNSLADVTDALRKDTAKYQGWAPAPRLVADPQPPAPAVYSSLRDRDLPAALAKSRGL